ncbi:hypothetical protein N7490_010749 [Penicillium lividum]|nr:hypothetical protein N7490_010749 [Penicillium lividum]
MSSVTASRVKVFNGLRRPEFDINDLPNHYHISVRSIPLVAGNAIFLANPFNGHTHCEGRTRIIPLTYEEQATVIVPLLLESFVTRFDNDSISIPMADKKTAYAPWSWSTSDAKLADALSVRLQIVGVRPELCAVYLADPEEKTTADACWRRFYNDLAAATMGIPEDQFAGNVNKVCRVCGFTPSLDTPLLRCARCTGVSYCSKACQKADWSEHKVKCKAPAA